MENGCSSQRWACSSAGRAPALQAGGHRFDPGHVHHFPKKNSDFMRSARYWRFQCHPSVTASDFFSHDSARATQKTERTPRFQSIARQAEIAYRMYAQYAFKPRELSSARRNDFCRVLDFILSYFAGMRVDRVHRERGSAFTRKTLDDLGVSTARSSPTADPVIDCSGTDIAAELREKPRRRS